MATLAAAEDPPADGGTGVKDVKTPAPAGRALRAAPVRRAGRGTGRPPRPGRWRSGGSAHPPHVFPSGAVGAETDRAKPI